MLDDKDLILRSLSVRCEDFHFLLELFCSITLVFFLNKCDSHISQKAEIIQSFSYDAGNKNFDDSLNSLQRYYGSLLDVERRAS